MKESTLAEIKLQLRRFHELVMKLNEYWDEPHLTTISVLLQNAGFSGTNCMGYSHEKAVKELFQLRDLINSISYYLGKEYHFEKWIANEVSNIINGEMMMETEEDVEQ